MVDYIIKCYNEYQIDRYRRGVDYIFNREVTGWDDINDAIKSCIKKFNSAPIGTTLDFEHPKTRRLVKRLVKTERPVEPWGTQWSEGSRMNGKNYIMRNGNLYVVEGTSRTANKVA